MCPVDAAAPLPEGAAPADRGPARGVPAVGAGAGSDTTVDGRVLRGERTRAAIVEALLGLLADGELHPTARQIAQRAGVSVRSIFQHFDDLEGLYGDLVKVQAGRVQPLVEDLRAEGSLDERVEALATQRAALFEAIMPMRHALGTRARTSPALAGRIRALSDQLHDQVRAQFAPELVGPDAEHLARALDTLCSFDSWDHLRGYHGLDVDAATAALRTSVRLLLRPATQRDR